MVLNDFGLNDSEQKAFEQSVYVLKEMRNECAHLELVTRFRLKRTQKLGYYNDITTYAGLSRYDLNYMDILKIMKIFVNINDIKRMILIFYLTMCLKGRKKIANKLLSKMGRKNIWEWMKI